MRALDPSISIARPWLALQMFGAVALMATGLGMAHGPWDRQLFTFINAWAPALPHTASALSVLGLGASMFVLAAMAGQRRPQMPAALVLCVIGGGLAVQLLKSWMAWPRPASVLGPQELVIIGMTLKGRGMPSGHAAMFAVVATLAWLWPWSSGSRSCRRGAAATLSVLALAGALARVVVGAHWPSDVLAGAGLGLATGLLVVGTDAGRRAVQWVADALSGRAGSRLMVALLASTSASLWVAERELPLAQTWYAGLSLLGVVAASRWWRLHPDPLTQSLTQAVTRVWSRRLSLRP